MVTLTVVLVRNAETIPNPTRLHQQLDPPLTAAGYQQAQATWTHLIESILAQTPRRRRSESSNNNDDDANVDPLRNMACFSAPLRACQATAFLLTATGALTHQDRLTWRYTTVEAASSPTAVPIITVNTLATTTTVTTFDDQQQHSSSTLRQCGSIHTVIAAGLLPTAAAPWNNDQPPARTKSPLLNVIVHDMKATAQPYVQEWKQDRTVEPPRKVLEAQWLRLKGEEEADEGDEDGGGVWDLTPMCPKVNLLVDLLAINKYMEPPRRGKMTLKLTQDEEEEEEEEDVPTIIASTVYKARQVGCDTVFLVVPAPVWTAMQTHVGGESAEDHDGVLILLGHTQTNDSPSSMQWEHCSTIPPFPGPVDCVVPPPPGKDPSSVPPNQWSLFPPPPPENIPDDYPDLPPFGMALSSPPPPEVEWSDDGSSDASSVLSERAPPPAEDGEDASSDVSSLLSERTEQPTNADASSSSGSSEASSVLSDRPEQAPQPIAPPKQKTPPPRRAGPVSTAGRKGRGPGRGPAPGRAGGRGRSGRGRTAAAARGGRGPVKKRVAVAQKQQQ